MITAPRWVAHPASCRRRSAVSTTPLGHWCAGVSTQPRAPVAASRPTSMPDSSTGTGTARTPAASAGAALGAPLAGRLIDVGGATPGYLFASAAGLLAVLILLLRGRDLG